MGNEGNGESGSPSVNLYIETSVHGPRQQGGRYMYLLECFGADGAPHTRAALGEWQEEKETALALQALAEALGRLRQPCVLDVYTSCRHLAAALDNGWAEAWEENGWKTARGKEIRHKALWERAAPLLGEHLVFARRETHSYQGWMQDQIRRMDKEGGKQDV